MLVLYVRTGCPYCAKVIDELQNLGVPYEERNIADVGVAGELIARGGKRQVPYLVDSERGVELYESMDIVHYLNEHYAASAK